MAVTCTVYQTTKTFNYAWNAASGLLEGMSSGDFGVTRGYEAQRPVLAYVENKFGANVISRYDYSVDPAGRRTVAALSGSAFGDMGTTSFGYGYNSRSELTAAQRVFGANPETGDPVAEQDYEYGYDPIGNRIRSTLGKANREMTYTANNVNQYTARTVPDAFAVFGTAAEDATVSINSELAARQAAYYSGVLDAENNASAVYTQVVVEAVGTNENLSAATGRVFVAQTPEAFTYDADGNMTLDGRFSHTWNAENRLIWAETRTNLPAEVPRVRLTMQYDHQGRRVERSRETFDGTNWNWQETRRFVYDGWNLIGETHVTDVGTSTNWYVWGLDLSGTIQGAGGVGGLLWSSIGGPSSREAVFSTFDGNGNVSELVSINGTIGAHYEYDPFGNPTAEEGELADANPFRFSSKYWDADTKLLAYQLRDYGPGIGRWLSRDPIGSWGGIHLYTFISNKYPNYVDALGLYALNWENIQNASAEEVSMAICVLKNMKLEKYQNSLVKLEDLKSKGKIQYGDMAPSSLIQGYGEADHFAGSIIINTVQRPGLGDMVMGEFVKYLMHESFHLDQDIGATLDCGFTQALERYIENIVNAFKGVHSA